MTTPIARIELAIRGRADFVKSILVAVFGKDPKTEREDKFLEAPPDPAKAAQQLLEFVNSRQAHDARHRRKK